MLGGEELTGYLGAKPRPVRSRHRPVAGQSGRLVESGDPPGNFQSEWAHVVLDNLERGTEPGRLLIVAFRKAWPFELLLPELGQRVQTAAEQRPHLLRCHLIPCGKTVEPGHARADPHPGRLPRSV
jgi:hypothetical protein